MQRWQFSWEVIKRKVLDDLSFILLLRMIHCLVTCTEFMKGYFSTNFGVPEKKIKVMPNWVNLERFNPAKYDRKKLRREFQVKESTRVVLFVHWLSPRKGPQYLVEIAQRVRREVPNVMFVVVGEGPYRETLEREVEASGLSGIIKLAGAVPNQEISRYYAIADLFIMPSQEEGFPRVLIEAMAMGVPFVATDVGSVNEITTDVQKEGVVPKGKIQAFADKVIKLLKNDELRNELGREGLNRVKDFSKGKVADVFSSYIAALG